MDDITGQAHGGECAACGAEGTYAANADGERLCVTDAAEQRGRGLVITWDEDAPQSADEQAGAVSATVYCEYDGIPISMSPAGYWSADGSDDRVAITCGEGPENRHGFRPDEDDEDDEGPECTCEYYRHSCGGDIPESELEGHESRCGGHVLAYFQGIRNAPPYAPEQRGGCAYCRVLAPMSDLEKFNAAGNLACIATVPCQLRQAGIDPVSALGALLRWSRRRLGDMTTLELAELAIDADEYPTDVHIHLSSRGDSAAALEAARARR
jgi:hypothetical protein